MSVHFSNRSLAAVFAVFETAEDALELIAFVFLAVVGEVVDSLESWVVVEVGGDWRWYWLMNSYCWRGESCCWRSDGVDTDRVEKCCRDRGTILMDLRQSEWQSVCSSPPWSGGGE